MRKSFLTFLFCLSLIIATSTTANAQTTRAEAITKSEQAYQQGRFDDVIQLTSDVLKVNGNDDSALYFRASARIEKGIRIGNRQLIRDGITDARQAIAAMPTVNPNYYLPYLYGMSHLTVLEDDPKHATVSINVADQVLTQLADKLTPEHKAHLLFQRGQAKLFKKEYDAAVGDYNLALQQIPSHMGAMMAIADTYVAAGRTADAAKAYDAVVQRFPKNPLVYNNRGMFLQREGNFDKAIINFSQALQVEPKYFVALTNRGFSQLELGKPSLAEQDFTASLAIQKDQPTVYSLRGTARLDQGKVTEAIEDYKAVLNYVSENPLARADLAFGYYFAKQYAQAAESFDMALAKDPELTHLVPWQYASKILSNQMDAANTMTVSLTKKPSDKRVWTDSITLFLMGRLTAEELLAKAKVGDKQVQQAQLCDAYYFIGQRTANLGDPVLAMDNYKKAVATGQRRLSSYRGAQFALGQFAK